MAGEVFNRVEKKYFVPKSNFPALMADLKNYMVVDSYHKDNPEYTICNIYYDTEDFDLIRSSLMHPVYKEKLRLRSYGTPGLDGIAYLEIKKKYHGAVNKRRISLPLEAAYAYLQYGIRPLNVNPQVLKEIDYVLSRRALVPQVYLAYDRLGFFSKNEPDLRITFDEHIRYRTENVNLEFGSEGLPLLRDDVWLMEVKAEKQVPCWMAQLLTKYQLVISSFSKYGTVYEKILKNQKQREVLRPCLTPFLAP